MKRTLLILTAGVCLALPAQLRANDPTEPPPPPEGAGGFHRHGPPLTEDERAELKAAHEAAIKANPALETEGKALREQMEAYRQKMHDALVAADPKVEPILAKMEHHHGPPPPDGGDGPQ